MRGRGGREQAAERSILVFDSDCALCSLSANFVAAHDSGGRFWYADKASPTGRQLLLDRELDPERLDALVLIAGAATYTGSSAGLKTAAMLGLPWSLAGLLRAVPAFLREPLYRVVARNRHRLSGHAACPVSHPRLAERMFE